MQSIGGACARRGTQRSTIDPLPPDLERAFRLDPRYQTGFGDLSLNQKADLIRWIESSGGPEHRRRRIDMAIRSLH